MAADMKLGKWALLASVLALLLLWAGWLILAPLYYQRRGAEELHARAQNALRNVPGASELLRSHQYPVQVLERVRATRAGTIAELRPFIVCYDDVQMFTVRDQTYEVYFYTYDGLQLWSVSVSYDKEGRIVSLTYE